MAGQQSQEAIGIPATDNMDPSHRAILEALDAHQPAEYVHYRTVAIDARISAQDANACLYRLRVIGLVESSQGGTAWRLRR